MPAQAKKPKKRRIASKKASPASLRDRLRGVLDGAGVNPHDRFVWIRAVDALPLHNAEVLVYVLEHSIRDDILYLTKNLEEKINAIKDKNETLLKQIFEDEKRYVKRR